MPSTNPELKTLQAAIKYFADPERARLYFVARRWPDGVTCPHCGSSNVAWQAKYNRWQCNVRHPRRQFTCKTGSMMEDSPLTLEKWMMAFWMICNCKNGVSSWEIHRAIGVTQKSAWFMLHRIRLAMHEGGMAFGGEGKEVEVDETFIGGKARNMHKNVKARRILGQGHHAKDKVIVMGILERGEEKGGSKVMTTIVPDRVKATVQPIVRQHVMADSALYSDEHGGYCGLEDQYDHQVIDHAVQYVDGRVSTNGLENFWSLTKRMLGGTYVSVEPFHLFRYLDEQAFRFNNRGHRKEPIHDGQRFDMVLSQVVGKRVMYKELTGKTLEASSEPF